MLCNRATRRVGRAHTSEVHFSYLSAPSRPRAAALTTQGHDGRHGTPLSALRTIQKVLLLVPHRFSSLRASTPAPWRLRIHEQRQSSWLVPQQVEENCEDASEHDAPHDSESIRHLIGVRLRREADRGRGADEVWCGARGARSATTRRAPAFAPQMTCRFPG